MEPMCFYDIYVDLELSYLMLLHAYTIFVAFYFTFVLHHVLIYTVGRATRANRSSFFH
jgi:hypothetical protein